MDTTVPLGIIANEIISNSLKHAFTEDLQGKFKSGFAGKKIITRSINLFLALQLQITEKEFLITWN
jgi:two-component sensor histidine kinase